VLALALVSSWGRALLRRMLLVAAWAASAVLTLYGALAGRQARWSLAQAATRPR
jgi:hypothetical protein